MWVKVTINNKRLIRNEKDKIKVLFAEYGTQQSDETSVASHVNMSLAVEAWGGSSFCPTHYYIALNLCRKKLYAKPLPNEKLRQTRKFLRFSCTSFDNVVSKHSWPKL